MQIIGFADQFNAIFPYLWFLSVSIVMLLLQPHARVLFLMLTLFVHRRFGLILKSQTLMK